jgi:adiponectin receptor
MRDNEFILSGYRINFTTSKSILRSLFLLHNETINVWSHILGVLFFISLLAWTIICVNYTNYSTYSTSTEI